MAAANTLQVLVVDDEAPARRKILRLLRQEPDVEVVGEAGGAESAIAAIAKHRPELTVRYLLQRVRLETPRRLAAGA